jgi:hypothetical protein
MEAMTRRTRGPNESERQLRTWLESVADVTIFMADGWFGVPYDNAHRWTSLLIGPACTVLEFDGETVLAAFGRSVVTIDDVRPVLENSPEPPAPNGSWSTFLIVSDRILLASAGDEGVPTIRGFESEIRYAILVGPRRVASGAGSRQVM